MAKKNRNAAEEATIEATAQPVEEKVEFETWFSTRERKIPKQHHKEILMADFKSRGLSLLETSSKFDEALKKYGIVLE